MLLLWFAQLFADCPWVTNACVRSVVTWLLFWLVRFTFYGAAWIILRLACSSLIFGSSLIIESAWQLRDFRLKDQHRHGVCDLVDTRRITMSTTVFKYYATFELQLNASASAKIESSYLLIVMHLVVGSRGWSRQDLNRWKSWEKLFWRWHFKGSSENFADELLQLSAIYWLSNWDSSERMNLKKRWSRAQQAWFPLSFIKPIWRAEITNIL